MSTERAESQSSTLENFGWNQDVDNFFGVKSPEVELINPGKDEKKDNKDSTDGKDGKSKPEQQQQQSEPESEHTWFESETTESANQANKGQHEELEDQGSEDTGSAAEHQDAVNAEDGKEGKEKGKGAGKGTGAEGKGSENEAPSGDTEFYTALAEELRDKNILSPELFEEDAEITEEKFFELQEQEINNRADGIFEGFIEEIKADEDAIAFIKFKRNGGSTAAFFNAFGRNAGLPDDLDLTKEGDQKKVLTFYFTNVEKLDPEDLDEKLSFYEEKGLTEKYAKKYHGEIVAEREQTRQAALKAQEDAKVASLENAKKLRTDLQTILVGGKGHDGIKFSPDDAKTLVAYVTNPTVKLPNGRMVTPFQEAMGKAMGDKTLFLTLAKLAKNGWKIPELEKAAETKVTNKIKNKLKETRKNVGLASSGAAKGIESVAELFEE